MGINKEVLLYNQIWIIQILFFFKKNNKFILKYFFLDVNAEISSTVCL